MINLFDTIQNYVTGGTWLTGKCDGTSTNTLDISDPTNVDTSPITVTGEYWFNYTTTNSPSGCDGCTEVKINILANDYTVGVAEDIDVCSSNLNPYDLETDIYNWTNPPTLDDIVPQWDLFVIFPSSDCAVLNQFGSNLVGSNIQSNITQVDDLNISSCSAGNTINAILRGRYVFPDGNSCVKEVNFNVNIINCAPQCFQQFTIEPSAVCLGTNTGSFGVNLDYISTNNGTVTINQSFTNWSDVISIINANTPYTAYCDNGKFKIDTINGDVITSVNFTQGTFPIILDFYPCIANYPCFEVQPSSVTGTQMCTNFVAVGSTLVSFTTNNATTMINDSFNQDLDLQSDLTNNTIFIFDCVGSTPTLFSPTTTDIPLSFEVIMNGVTETFNIIPC